MQIRPLWLVNLGLLLLIACTASDHPQKSGPEQSSSLTATLENGAPFSLVYDGKPAKDFLASWQKSETVQSLSGGRTLRTITYRDPATHLEVSREITIFPGAHAIEWMLRLRNGGTADSALLENILPLDVDLPVPTGGPVTFHYVHGSRKEPDYAPVDRDLTPGTNLQIAHYIMQNDVHEDGYLPFFNLQWPGGGVVGAIGWTGQWMVSAARSPGTVALKSGQELTHLRLHAGESIRTPRVLLVEWSGTDRMVGQNALRSLLISYYAARVQGELVMPPVAHTEAYALIFDGIAKKTGRNPLDILPTVTAQDLGGHGGRGFPGPGDALNYVTEKNQLEVIHNLPPIGIEAYWLDAGWMQGLWPVGRGSWVPNKEFAGGLRPLGEAAHQKGLKFLLWFDPGRCGSGKRDRKGASGMGSSPA